MYHINTTKSSTLRVLVFPCYWYFSLFSFQVRTSRVTLTITINIYNAPGILRSPRIALTSLWHGTYIFPFCWVVVCFSSHKCSLALDLVYFLSLKQLSKYRPVSSEVLLRTFKCFDILREIAYRFSLPYFWKIQNLYLNTQIVKYLKWQVTSVHLLGYKGQGGNLKNRNLKSHSIESCWRLAIQIHVIYTLISIALKALCISEYSNLQICMWIYPFSNKVKKALCSDENSS
jgi:hypothetical protein